MFPYLYGFNNHLKSEALPNLLPTDGIFMRNDIKYGLYFEQLNATPFTQSTENNCHAILYRLIPPCSNLSFEELKDDHDKNSLYISNFNKLLPSPPKVSYYPSLIQDNNNNNNNNDFLQSIRTLCGNGSPNQGNGVGISTYSFKKSMSPKKKAMVNNDGWYLFMPSNGTIILRTEFGYLEVPPSYIAVIPNGVVFSVDNINENNECSGHLIESFGSNPFQLPSRGVIGANGLAAESDFEMPVAAFSDEKDDWITFCRFDGELFQATTVCPFNVVGWVGTGVIPYRYNLQKFNALSSRLGHPDPSIHTVLTLPSAINGRAIIDVVAFVPRVNGSNGFRAVYPHRNAASEFNIVVNNNGNKPFVNGASWLTPFLAPHGIPPKAYENQLELPNEREPEVPSNSSQLWTMIESCLSFRQTPYALNLMKQNPEFTNRCVGYKRRFTEIDN